MLHRLILWGNLLFYLSLPMCCVNVTATPGIYMKFVGTDLKEPQRTFSGGHDRRSFNSRAGVSIPPKVDAAFPTQTLWTFRNFSSKSKLNLLRHLLGALEGMVGLGGGGVRGLTY